MRQLLSLCVAAVAILFCACQGGSYKKTKDGLEYKLFAGKDIKDSVLKTGDFIKFNVEFSIKKKGKKDSLIYSTYTGMPQYNRVDTVNHHDMNYTELFPLMRVGDSAEFRVNVDTLIARNIMQENPIFTKGSQIVGKVSILAKYKTEADVYADIAKEISKEKGHEMTDVQAYIKDNNLKATMTKDSVFVVLDNPGDPTAKADSGLEVAVKYEGRLMKNDTIFDSNLKRNDSLKIVLGQHMVIPGWESGLKEFGKGGKGKIIIPGFMGYGPQPMGKIPANSNLVFDVEVLDVRTPSPKPAQHAGPKIDPQMLKKLQEQQKGAAPKTAAPAVPKK
ncbi:MAG: FKBP-type peptidyl-prolyl cis-trans isomerase [Chitinophagaceae bacterium]